MENNQEINTLYPIFLKLHQLNMLIVGAGEVGYEKLFFILKSSPQARITVVANWINPEIRALLAAKAGQHRVTIIEKDFAPADIEGHQLVIAATNIRPLNARIREEASRRGKLVNVADTPDLCDFYLGSIVTRGNLKVAISTNGKSPTFAKRFRQVLEEILPENTNDLLLQLGAIRDQLKGGFAEKVKQLNDLTASLLSTNSDQEKC